MTNEQLEKSVQRLEDTVLVFRVLLLDMLEAEERKIAKQKEALALRNKNKAGGDRGGTA